MNDDRTHRAETFGAGKTIVHGFCPGCLLLHCTTDCPENNPREAQYCICCEAIAAEGARRPNED